MPTLPVWSGRFASVRGGLGGQRLFSDWLMVGGEGGVVVVIFGVFGTGREREAGQPPCLSRLHVPSLVPRRGIAGCGVCMPIHFMAGGGRDLVSFGLKPLSPVFKLSFNMAATQFMCSGFGGKTGRRVRVRMLRRWRAELRCVEFAAACLSVLHST